MKRRLCLYELPMLTEDESDFVATVTSDPGQAQDFTNGFERLVEAVNDTRADLYRLAEYQGAVAMWTAYCEEGPDLYPFWPIWNRPSWLASEEARIFGKEGA